MSNIYFMCDNCGIETNGFTFVNGMKFCAKCYHQIFGKDNQQTEIAQLKQQLAEKDKEIEKLNAIKNNAIECADLFKVALSVRQKDLAIQELEKLKKQIDNLYIYSFKGESEIGDELISSGELISAIDNQIKELKGEGYGISKAIIKKASAND